MSGEKKRVQTAVGKRIQDLRQARDMSQHDLSVASGVDKVKIWRIESGETQSPSIDNIIAIARGLRVSVNEITGTEDRPHDPLEGAIASFRREVEILPEQYRPGAIRDAQIFVRGIRAQITKQGEPYKLIEGEPEQELEEEA